MYSLSRDQEDSCPPGKGRACASRFRPGRTELNSSSCPIRRPNHTPKIHLFITAVGSTMGTTMRGRGEKDRPSRVFAPSKSGVCRRPPSTFPISRRLLFLSVRESRDTFCKDIGLRQREDVHTSSHGRSSLRMLRSTMVRRLVVWLRDIDATQEHVEGGHTCKISPGHSFS